MAEKPDYYEVLGVAKTATPAEIKSAQTKAVFKWHPDRFRNKSEAEKAEAAQRFLLLTEAFDVLSDPEKRAAYDKFGHRGLDNMKDGKPATNGQSYAEAAGEIKVREVFTTENTIDFFEKRSAKLGDNNGAAQNPSNISSARQERLKRFANGAPPAETAYTPPKPEPVPPKQSPVTPPVKDTFSDVADKVTEAAGKLAQGNVAIPVEALERFRDNLNDLLKVVDAAIAQNKKGPGFNP